MQVLYTAILVEVDSLVFPQTWMVNRPRFVAALPMRLLISALKRQIVADGGPKVCKLVDNIKYVVVNGNDRRSIHVLA